MNMFLLFRGSPESMIMPRNDEQRVSMWFMTTFASRSLTDGKDSPGVAIIVGIVATVRSL